MTARRNGYATKAQLENALERAAALDREEKPHARVYFVRESTLNAIKIGTSTRVTARLDMIRCNNPGEVSLIAQICGGRRVEAVLHEHFSHVRVRGEWFASDPELIELIESFPVDCDKRDIDALFERRRKMKVIA